MLSCRCSEDHSSISIKGSMSDATLSHRRSSEKNCDILRGAGFVPCLPCIVSASPVSVARADLENQSARNGCIQRALGPAIEPCSACRRRRPRYLIVMELIPSKHEGKTIFERTSRFNYRGILLLAVEGANRQMIVDGSARAQKALGDWASREPTASNDAGRCSIK